MKMTPQPCPPRDQSRIRLGFTLIEMLVVVGLIGLLATILLMAARGQITSARRAATLTTLTKISAELDNRYKALKTHWDGLREDQRAQNYKNYRDPDSGRIPEVARTLAWKDLCRSNIPQRFSEIYQSDGVTQLVGDAVPNGTESAEVLFYLITGEEIPNSGTPPVKLQIPGYSSIGADAFSTADMADTDQDGRREFIDGWGQPLRFYRWPTRLITSGNAGLLIRSLPSLTDLNSDPDDPLFPRSKDDWAQFATCESKWHTPNVWHTRLVVSAGADGILGLYEPTDTTNYGYLAAVDPATASALNDDITNLNFSPGGN